jgi:tetratricopeptide (TPR) repeat protein
MRRINFAFAAIVFAVFAAAAGGFHLLHIVQAGRIAESIRWQAERARDDGRSDDAIHYASQYLEFRPDDVSVLTDLADWLLRRAKTYKQLAGVLGVYEHILRVTPDDRETRLKAADLAANLYAWAQALENLDILLRGQPADAGLCERYGYCQQMVGRYDDAAGWYRKAIQADPKQVSAYLGYAGLLHYHLRRPDEAMRLAEQAVQANPDSAAAYAGLAQFLRARGRYEDATIAVRKAQALTKDDAKDDAQVLLVAAEIEQANGNYDTARALLETGTRKYPTKSRFTCSLAWLLLYEGHPDRAIATLRAGRAANPKDVDILTLLGDLLAQDGQVGPLEQALKELTELNAPADRVQYVESRLLMRRGRYAAAAAKLDKLRAGALRTPNLYRQANHLLAQCYEQLNDAAGELDAFRRLLDNDPDAGTVRLEYARALARLGRPDDARRELLAVLAQPQVSSRAVAEAARALIAQARRDPKAWDELAKAIDGLKLDDANPNPVVARAALDLARRRPADSWKAVEQAVHKLPKNVALHVARAALAAQQFGTDRALAALAEAEALVGDHAEVRAARARLYAARLDPAAADLLAGQARGAERFGGEDRRRVLSEVIAGFRALDDAANVTLYLELLAQLRPDYLPAREALYARAVRAGDEPRRQSALREIEAVEGKDGPTAHVLEARRLLWLAAPGDAAALAQVTARLDAALQARPGEAVIEFLRGRVAELAGRGPDALRHYQAAFDRGLADRPVEDLLAEITGHSGAAPVAVLRDQLPLADRLQPDRHRTLLLAALPLYDAAALAKLAERLAADPAAADGPTQVWLGRVFARRGLERPAEEALRRAAAAAPESSDGWQALVACRAAGADAAATRAVVEEVRGKLAPIEANLVIGRALESARQLDAARHEYEAALALKPNDTRALKLLATLHQRAGRPAEARQALETIAAIPTPSAPEDARWARRTLAVQLSATGSLESFRKALTLLDANAVNGQLSDDDQRARVLVLMAQKGRPLDGTRLTARQEAIRILEGLQKQRSARTADDLTLLAGLYRAENDAAKARAARDRLRAEYPTHYGCVAFLAREALRDHDLPACEQLLPALRRLRPDQPEAVAIEFQYRVLAGTPDLARRRLDDYVAGGGTDAARTTRAVWAANQVYDFLQARPLKPEAAADLRATAVRLYRPEAGRSPDAFQRLVMLQAQQPGGTPDAILAWQKYKAAFPPEVAAATYVQIVRYGSADGAQVQAVAHYLAEALAKQPQSTPLRLIQAEFFELNGDHARAVAAYRDVLARDPGNVQALNNLAWSLSLDKRDKDKVRESLEHIQRAIDLAGPVDELLDTKARILFESGRQEDGLRDMCEAVNEAPSAARWLNYATLLRRAGKTEQSERALAEAKRYGLGNEAPR